MKYQDDSCQKLWKYTYIYSTATSRCSRESMFLGWQPWVHQGMWPVSMISLAWYLTNQWMVDDVVEATDELIRFWRSIESRSGLQQGQIFGRVIAAGRDIHVDTWHWKYHLVVILKSDVILEPYNKKAQVSLTNLRDACEKFARFT